MAPGLTRSKKLLVTRADDLFTASRLVSPSVFQVADAELFVAVSPRALAPFGAGPLHEA